MDPIFDMGRPLRGKSHLTEGEKSAIRAQAYPAIVDFAEADGDVETAAIVRQPE